MTAKLSPVIPMRCPRCGHKWNLPRRADGTYPQTAGCPKLRGGCGHVVKVPRYAHTGRRVAPPAPAAAGSGEPAEWSPPSEPRGVYPVAEPCPHCGETKVYAEPRGTMRLCLGCKERVTPPGVLAPYARGAGVTRTAKSQRERDLEALDLAGRKGVMLGQLRDLAADERLDPASQLKVEWFAEQVKGAAGAARLDELAALFSEAGIRRRRFWQGRPAALTAGYAGEDSDDEDEDGDGDAGDGYAGYADDDEDQADEPAAVLATPASITAQQHRAQPQRMTWAAAISACGWRLSPVTGGCQITGQHGQPCGRDTTRHIGDGWVCGTHHAELAAMIAKHNREIA